MAEQRVGVPKEAGTENEARDPLIVQKFLKSVAVLPATLPPLEENATESQASTGRDKENPQQEISGWSRGESVLQRDPNISAKAWTGREKLDFCMKVKVKETLKEVDLGSQWPLQLRQFGPQDAEQHQEMSSKRKSSSTTEGSKKKQRKVISLNLKMKIIKAYEAGKKVTNIAQEEGLAHSTISAILKDKERIKEATKGSSGMTTSIIRKQKHLVHEMEKLLILWIEDQIQKRLPVSLFLIQNKARSIFSTLKERAGDECTETFTASRGWFMRFQLRFHYQKTHRLGKADKEAGKHFPDELDNVVAEGNYFAEQIFRVDETGLYWKRMPERTYIHREAQAIPGCKAFKDRVTLLLGGNVAGFKLTPFLILKSDHACMFQNINKDTLPVHYRFDCKAWMTHVLFEDWFTNCFIPQVKEYCWQEGITFKILLLLDKAPGHPLHLDSLHPNIKVVYLPQNTTTLVQPVGQGAISAFKAYYLHAVFAKAFATVDHERLTLTEFWKSYNILHCIENIVAAWQDVSVKCMQGFWRKYLKCFPLLVNNSVGFDQNQTVDEINKKILTLAKFLDLEVDAKEVKKWIAYAEGELSNEELIELKEELEAQKVVEEEVEKEKEKVEKEKEKVEKEKEKVVEIEPKTFSLKRLAGVFSSVNKVLSELKRMDPDVERFSKVHWEMSEILKCYREIYEGKKKERNDKETKQKDCRKEVTPSPAPLPLLLPFPSTGIQRPEDPQPSTSYASRFALPENTENYECFQGFISNFMYAGVPKDTILKSPKLEEETFEIRKVKIPLDIKEEIDGEANSPEYDI
ncbi:tigger transposable element-derived protein 1-like isoform X2 [Ahaetulla prasina]|uniref:tigger transposable element-derived protein 1-like isoform X2 n=1 Tax=Ahaetulla prasina TaxID=499056 RepID=UPI002649EEF3|nr:tigger transposable element-derived protein 1-like isoform X2 [Ahaetulla prasina]XP_058029619.1 tigger transposable element-derived protein 1-like isoform X2 [Ahaetulla prasina]